MSDSKHLPVETPDANSPDRIRQNLALPQECKFPPSYSLIETEARQAVMFLSRAVKGTKLKTEAMQLLGKLAPTIKVFKSVIHQKQVIADSSGQAATVWELGGQPAKDSGKEYDGFALAYAYDCSKKSWERYRHDRKKTETP